MIKCRVKTNSVTLTVMVWANYQRELLHGEECIQMCCSSIYTKKLYVYVYTVHVCQLATGCLVDTSIP